MQPSAGSSGDVSLVLAERVSRNRIIVGTTARRLSVTTARTRAGRYQLVQSLQEARQSLAEIRTRRTARPGAPPRRPGPVRRDPVDGLRQRRHEEYAITRDPAIRDELLVAYDGLARSLALRLRQKDDADDLVQVARIGLFHAIERFDPARGFPFLPFARATITGELKRHLRDTTWAVRVPRSLQEHYLTVRAAIEELTAEGRESPSMIAVAERCGLPLDRVVEVTELHGARRPLSIDFPAGRDDGPVVEIRQEEVGFGLVDNGELLTALLQRLSPRDRRIIELRFVEEMTQAEIAAIVGVSQMCISRVLARTLGRMRSWARAAGH